MTKAPLPTEMSKGQSDNTNNATKKFDYTAIADRLRTELRTGLTKICGICDLQSFCCKHIDNTIQFLFNECSLVSCINMIKES